KLAVTSTGKLTDGLATSADFEAFGVTGQFSGKIENAQGGPEASGRVAVLIENTDQIFGVVGLPPRDSSPIGKVFSGEGIVRATRQSVDLKEIRGTVAGTSFSGALNLAYADATPSLNIQLQSGRLSLPFVLAGTMLGRNGNRQTAATRFSPEAMANLKAEVRLKTDKLELWSGYQARKGEVSLNTDPADGTLKLSASAVAVSDQPVRFELDAKIGAQLTRVSGKLSGPIKLSSLLQTNQNQSVLEGLAVVSGEFGGSGRTPGGLLASLGGKGTYQLSNGKIRNISPVRFSQNLSSAETAKDVENMIVQSLRTGDMQFGAGKGEVELANGVANFQPLALKSPGANGSMKVIYDLSAGLADISIRLKLAEPPKVPGFEVAYAGPPQSLAASSNFTALRSYLTVAALNRTLDKLEALEEEQRRLVEEEKKARAEAEEKRKAQQEKQRLLREKQRKLLEKATKKKAPPSQKKKPLPVPKVVVKPIPKPPVPTKTVTPKVPTPPATRATVTPQVQIDDLPPLEPEAAQPLFIPPAENPPRKNPPSNNWRKNLEIEGGR
ncbi:MAG TPA: hypothetical protein ENJ55_08020, partial [Rhizobiales bacterium]|nr:hypothetical protein [Hyphomicrobiales bacterium]